MDDRLKREDDVSYLIVCGTLLFFIGLLSGSPKTMISGAVTAGIGFAIMLAISLLDNR